MFDSLWYAPSSEEKEKVFAPKKSKNSREAEFIHKTPVKKFQNSNTISPRSRATLKKQAFN